MVHATPSHRSPLARRAPRLGHTAASLAAATVLLIVAAGCSSDDGEASEVRTGDAATLEATSPTPATTEASPTEATTTTMAATTGMASQEETVRRLYDAWYADDRATAATVAEPTAVEGMWRTARGDYSLYNQCSTGEFDTSGCLYRGANGTIQFTLEKRGDLWVVIEAFYAEP
jgi:hypothetical protein